MEKPEWRKIVGKLNASWPDQQISPETAAEWYTEVAHLDHGDVWLALRRLRTEQHWRPNLAEILATCKVQRIEMAEQARSQQLRFAGRRQGVPMPPETRKVLEILTEIERPDVTEAEREEAVLMIRALTRQLTERCPVVPVPGEPASA